MQIRSEEVVEELSVDGLDVRKSKLDLQRENVAGIKLELSTVGDRPLQVELVEVFPGHFSMGDVQVHPSYHPERWRTDAVGHRLVLETEVEPDAPFETIYGFRVSDVELEPFLEKPEVVAVEAADGGAAIRSKLDSSTGPPPDAPDGSQNGSPDGPRDRSTEEPRSDSLEGPHRESPGGLQPDSSEGPPSDSPAGPPRGSPDGRQPASPERPQHGSPDGPQPGEASADPAGGLDADGDPSETAFEFGEDRREVVGGGVEASASPTRRGQTTTEKATGSGRDAGDVDLESRLAELSTLSTAFDEVVDVVGSSAQAVVALGGAHEALADDVEELSTRAKAAAGDRDALRRRVETLEGAVEELRDDHADDVGDLDARLAELEETFADSDEFAAIREVVAAERAWRERSSPSRAPGGLTAAPGASDR